MIIFNGGMVLTLL